MNLIIKYVRFLVLLMPGLWLAGPAFADDGDSAICFPPVLGSPFPCPVDPPLMPGFAGVIRDHSRPGSVIVFPKFVKGGGSIAECGAGNVLVNGECLPRTEIELGATCPTRFTTG